METPAANPRKPLVVVKPAKKIADMTPQERRAFAEELAHAAVVAAALVASRVSQSPDGSRT